MLGLGGGGSSGADAGLVGRVGVAAGGWEGAVLPSFLAFGGLGAGALVLLLARFGRTGGGGTGGAWGWKSVCVACWLRSRSGGSAGACMVVSVRLQVMSASFYMVSKGSLGHGSAAGLSSKGWWRW